MLKGNNKNPRTRCEVFSELKIKTPEHGVNSEHVVAGWEEFLTASVSNYYNFI